MQNQVTRRNDKVEKLTKNTRRIDQRAFPHSDVAVSAMNRHWSTA